MFRFLDGPFGAAPRIRPLHAPDLALVEPQIRCSNIRSSPSFFADETSQMTSFGPSLRREKNRHISGHAVIHILLAALAGKI